MREFTDKEKGLLKQFVKLKKENKLSELQSAKFLKKELSCFAIKVQTKPITQLVIYVKHGSKFNQGEIPPEYFEIADFIYFIKELHQYKFIEIQLPVSKNKDSQEYDDIGMLYDKEKYIYNKENDTFHDKNDNLILEALDIPNAEIGCISKVYLDIVYDITKYGYAVIYPLPRLIDYVEYNFKTLEQRNFEEQLEEAKKSTCWSRVAAIVAIITVLFTICHTCCNQQNNSQQIYSIINAIQEQKSISIEHFPNIIPDTLNVKLTDKDDNQPINLNVTVKPDQPKQIK